MGILLRIRYYYSLYPRLLTSNKYLLCFIFHNFQLYLKEKLHRIEDSRFTIIAYALPGAS